jgi:hypothetical protein
MAHETVYAITDMTWQDFRADQLAEACRLDHCVGVLIMVVCVGAAAGACWVIGGQLWALACELRREQCQTLCGS